MSAVTRPDECSNECSKETCPSYTGPRLGSVGSRGVEGASVVQESVAWDTIGNAVFVRLLHTDVRRWHRLLLVT